MKKIHTFVVLAYKESPYLEECIKSVKNQTADSEVVVATSTPNKFITNIAKNNNLKIIVNKDKKGIGRDFDFAIECAKTKLVTIAHQDDVYDSSYAEEIINSYNKYPDSLIIFPNYYEIRGDKKIYNNLNLIIKKILLFPLRLTSLCHFRIFKRFSLMFGTAICCPSVTLVKNNFSMKNGLFQCNMRCNIDWYGWEKLSNLKGRFLYIPHYLMGHRVHEESTTTEIIKENSRTKEDLIMFQKFWPLPIAKLINYFYKYSEKNNKISNKG